MRTRMFQGFVGAWIVFALVAGVARAAAPTPPQGVPSALWDYVRKPDDSFQWTVREQSKIGGIRLTRIDLTSQTWAGIVWKHNLSVIEPPRLEYPNHVLLFITGGNNGGKPRTDGLLLGARLAQLSGARVAMLHQVPNQPLLDGRHEDDLITETWLRYLKSGDPEWPLLFPMVKSAVRAMDAIQALADKEWKTPVKGFVLTGASKRGWTSWLTPVVDPRVVATAPMVIDMLNMRRQMEYQLETWGSYSEQIDDYTSKNLVAKDKEQPRETELRTMMDPFTYRNLLTLPKLLIHGTNDRYWVVDAMKLYWDDLSGPKYTIAIPNAGHDLGGGRDQVAATLAVFFRHAASGRPLPEPNWNFQSKEGKITLTMTASPAPTAVRLWSAKSDTKDFRESKWSSQAMQSGPKGFTAELDRPKSQHLAIYGEFQFTRDGIPFSLTTVVHRF